MLKTLLKIFVLTAFLSVAIAAQNNKIESIYTDFGDKNCKELENQTPEDGLLYVGECRGVGDYKLIFYESEHHQSLDLIAPDGRKFDLNLIISAAPSYLGKVAEWRVRREGEKVIPLALIVRMNVFNDGNDPEKAESFLLVTKITKDAACLVEKVPPIGMAQNEKARIIADASAEKPCINSGENNS